MRLISMYIMLVLVIFSNMFAEVEIPFNVTQYYGLGNTTLGHMQIRTTGKFAILF